MDEHIIIFKWVGIHTVVLWKYMLNLNEKKKIDNDNNIIYK